MYTTSKGQRKIKQITPVTNPQKTSQVRTSITRNKTQRSHDKMITWHRKSIHGINQVSKHIKFMASINTKVKFEENQTITKLRTKKSNEAKGMH